MHFKKHKILGSLTALLISGTMLGSGTAAAQPNHDSAEAEVLTRGPVHEGFAGTVSFDPEPGIIIDQAPPALIEEVPPEQRLEGDNVSWIPGYWAWDEDQNDFLWISGIWRNLPPGRQWVPGYWAETEGRHQWTSGYWEDAEATEVSYLPEPPRSVEAGPNIEASSNDQTWVPGNWIWRDDRYAWRAGSYVAARPNWSWTPDYYRWTRRGYVYVDGYWDYPVIRRGVVFAPVRFQRAYISRPDFYYSPHTVISLSVFSNHLFLRPNYGHYYFGDYYEPRYRDRGFYASYSYSSGRRGYDPIYAHYRYENRNDRNWERGRRDYFEYRRDHQDARPPRTWAALNSRSQSDRERGDFGVAERFDRVVDNRGEGRQRFQAVGKQDRERFVSQRQEIRKFGREREQQEVRSDRTAVSGSKNDKQVSRVKVNRSPVVAKKSDRSDKDGGPPARLQTRGSERNQQTEKNGNSGKGPQGGRDDSAKSKAEKEKNDNVKGDGEGRKTGKSEPAVETRTKPGQKREAEPTSKRQANPTPERQANPTPKRQANPTPERQANPTPKRQANPTPERQANPTPKRQANPTPQRQANPTSKRQANPTPQRQANPTPKRQAADPTPQRQANPTPRRQASPTPQRQANPKPRRQASPTPQRQANPTPKRQASPTPQRQAKPDPQPQRQQAARPQPQKPREVAQPQRTGARQAKSEATTRSTTTAKEREEQKKRQKGE